MSPNPQTPSQIKSRKRVTDHGEVFTPDWLVNDMLNLVAHEAERIDSRFLEPACGEGAFLAPILLRKLATVRRHAAETAVAGRRAAGVCRRAGRARRAVERVFG